MVTYDYWSLVIPISLKRNQETVVEAPSNAKLIKVLAIKIKKNSSIRNCVLESYEKIPVKYFVLDFNDVLSILYLLWEVDG